MSGQEIGLAFSVFVACAVEAVEALTIVLAVGTTRSWRSALTGTAAAVVVLAVATAAIGPGLTSLPIDTLRLLVGGLLLVFGLQWLRKAILRAAGLRSQHDEEEIFREETAAATAAGAPPRGSRRLLLHDRVQGSPARGPRGGLHRLDLRREPAPRGSCGCCRRGRGPGSSQGSGSRSAPHWRGSRKTP